MVRHCGRIIGAFTSCSLVQINLTGFFTDREIAAP
jgi:hypothetical protein